MGASTNEYERITNFRALTKTCCHRPPTFPNIKSLSYAIANAGKTQYERVRTSTKEYERV